MMVTMSRNRICMEPMRQLNIHPSGFFSLRVRGVWMEFFYSCVLHYLEFRI
jgi:hypothetical protein